MTDVTVGAHHSYGVVSWRLPTRLRAVIPSTVPKALDVLIPNGVSPAEKLDHVVSTPVVIAPIAIP